MPLSCPCCGSSKIHSKDTGKLVAGSLGIVSGATLGYLAGARCFRGAPTHLALSCVAGAVIGAIAGAASTGVQAALLGQKIDQSLLKNYLCKQCGHHFSHSDNQSSAVYSAD